MRHSNKRAERSFTYLAGLLLAIVNVMVCMEFLDYSASRLTRPVLAKYLADDIICDIPVTDTINNASETETFNFTATDGERIEFTIVRTIRFGQNFQPSWRLVNRNGAGAGGCGSFDTKSQGECGPLSASGSPYQIQVRDSGQDDTGTFRMHLYRLPASTACENTPISCGVPITGTIDPALDSDLFNFTVANNETARVTIAKGSSTGPNFQPLWRLLRGDGTPASSCGSYTTNSQATCGPLQANGNPYRIEVQDANRDDIGSYVLTLNFQVNACPSPTISLTPDQLTVVAGSSEELRVTLNPTRNAQTTVTLSSSHTGIATVPATVNIPANTASVSFPVTGVSVGGPVTITATLPSNLGGSSAKSEVRVIAPRLALTACSPFRGTSCDMTVTIDPALKIDVTLTLSSSNSGIASVPASVKIPAGEKTATFPVTGVATGGPVTITAQLPDALGGGKATADVTVGPTLGTAQIDISPANPTTDDNISIKISGVWPNVCVPQDPRVTIVSNLIRIATSNPGQVCAQVVTAWSHTLDIGKLAAGDYNVIVTHSGQGRVTELGRTTFRVATSPLINRIVRVVDATGNPGGAARVPITLNSQGNENAISLSLSFDPDVLSNPQVALGSDANNALLTINPNQVAQGRIGILLALPAGQRFSSGLRQILVVTFAVAAGTNATTTTINPSDQPVPCQASDVNANSLPVSCVSGVVTITRGLEADVAPRPSGNGSLSIADCVQAGRFAAALDAPTTGQGGEFQRADSAPRDTRGDGRLAITDWVQACRYAAALDQPQPAGGPVSPTTTTTSAEAIANYAQTTEPRTVRAFNAAYERGETTFKVALDAQGDENAFGFSLRFDPAVWRFVSVSGGGDAIDATLHINANYAAEGRLGIALSLSTGKTLAAGMRELLTVKLAAISHITEDSTAIAFDDYPVAREVADAQANVLLARFAGLGTLRTVAVVSAASYRDRALASVSIASAFGVGLGTATEAATSSPLPTELAGTTLKVRDSAGIEHAAPLFFVSPNQINYLVPEGVSPGIASITVRRSDGGVTTGTTQLAEVSPGLFTADASGQGAAAALVLRIKVDGTQSYESVAHFDSEQNKFVTTPIDLGDESDQVFLILFGTGFGAKSATAAVNVKLGGVDVPVLFAGAQGDYAGLDQVNLSLPRSLAGRGEVDVTLWVDKEHSNNVRVRIR